MGCTLIYKKPIYKKKKKQVLGAKHYSTARKQFEILICISWLNGPSICLKICLIAWFPFVILYSIFYNSF